VTEKQIIAKKNMLNRPFFISLLLTISGLGTAQDESFLTIGTGAVTGVYYPVGGAICQLVNIHRQEHGLRCLVESTEGSIANLEAIRAGNLDIGVVQSDWQYHAVHGTSRFADAGPDQDLRALFSLYSEPFTVVARSDAEIRVLDDLKGKRINIGNPGSGQRATMEVLMMLKGWTADTFAKLLELPPDEQPRLLCGNQVDAFVFTAGHPNRSILETTTLCDATIVEVSGPDIDKLLVENPSYARATVPGGIYRGNPDDIATFGVKATVVSSTRLSDETAYQVVRSVFDDFSDFRRLHPALADLHKQRMVRDGNSAPLHPGAQRYFEEAGLLP
jgi:TRAP transporter TAXI family solute receptor